MLCAGIAQDIGFTRKFPKERRIGDYGRLREYFLWRQARLVLVVKDPG